MYAMLLQYNNLNFNHDLDDHKRNYINLLFVIQQEQLVASIINSSKNNHIKLNHISYLKMVYIISLNVQLDLDISFLNNHYHLNTLQNGNVIYLFSYNLNDIYHDQQIHHFQILIFYHLYLPLFLSNLLSIYIHYYLYFYVKEHCVIHYVHILNNKMHHILDIFLYNDVFFQNHMYVLIHVLFKMV